MSLRSHRLALLCAAGAVSLATACGGGFGSSAAPSQSAGKASLHMLIASSGDAETAAVQAAAAQWAAKTGNTVSVTAAQNMDQQLGQAFAANKPPDVFYLDAARFADYASSGQLYAYGDQAAGAADFYPSLKAAFSYKGTFYCAPKDFSTLALEINSQLWTRAGLTASDYPTTWDQLTSDLRTLKAKIPSVAPMVISTGHDRADAFLVQAGGGIVDSTGAVTATSSQNIQALTYLQGLLKAGLVQFNTQVGTGWGGEAFGKQKAVTTIEGNWIEGAMRSDYPTVKYAIAPLPAGPAGKGTLAFTNCWGIPTQTAYKQQALDLVNSLTAPEQQLAFAKAFGVMPSRQSAEAAYLQQFPSDAPFLQGGAYGVGPVKAPKITSVLSDYDNSLTKLATTPPAAILDRLQTNLTAATGQ